MKTCVYKRRFSRFERPFRSCSYRKITVTALCRQAVINKKTFYRYYDSVDALLEEILSEFSKGYVDTIADYRVPEDLDKINAAFFHYAGHE